MKKIDYHLHTSFSFDSTGNPEDYIRKAIDVGLDEICFTDHNDFEPTNVWALAVEDYMKALLPLKEKYKDQILVKIGIEVGLDMMTKERVENLVALYPFDFVIGSIHTYKMEDMGAMDFYLHKTKEEVHDIYFHAMKECVEKIDAFDVLGHLDYIRRYGPYEDKCIDYGVYQDIIDEVFAMLISKGKGIEINLSGFRTAANESLPNYEQIKRYYDLGGRIITIGTDSHTVDTVGMDVDRAIAMCKEIGFTEISTYTQRKLDRH